ncbi:MAG: ferrochelatase [Arsenophonus sp.]|nr:MAG: ferrochelatase [Arsenophonus sp.]
MKKNVVVLVNHGSPSSFKKRDVFNYLRNFLIDPKVIKISKFVWIPLLYFFILPFRVFKICKFYKSIWTKFGSPLMMNSLKQKEFLLNYFKNTSVRIGMSYGKPFLSEILKKILKDNTIEKLIILPLYPQYSSTTTGSVFKKISEIMNKYYTIPEIHFIRSYASNPHYIYALKKTIEKSFLKYGIPEKLIISYHSIPISYVKKGDIYLKECQLTSNLLIQSISLSKEDIIISYQSNFKFYSWLKPYTENILKKLAKKGVKKVQVICPGFSVDCLETLEEISMRNKKIFLSLGGKDYRYIPALNFSKDSISLIKEIIKPYIQEK